MYLSNNSARVVDFFGFDWHFRLADEGGDTAGEGLAGYRPVQLPHDWSLEYPFDEKAATCGSGGYVQAGVGWYKKLFRVSAASKGKRVSLLFDGAYMCATVWLNGSNLGTHIYGYTPFEFNITDVLDYDGENEIAVRIDNSSQPNSRWYTGSGITRDVWLKCVSCDHIPTYGTYVTANPLTDNAAEINIKTKVELPGGSADLTTAIFDMEQGQVAFARATVTQSAEAQQTIMLQDAYLWTAETPYLYRAVSTLRRGGEVLDEYETVFGIRKVEFDSDRGCLINGVRVKLNGVCLHHDGGAVGAAVPKNLWRRRLLRLKEMGCNAIRTAHNPPDPALLDLCDELGFYVMDEAFDEWALLKLKVFGSNTHESRGYSEWFSDNHVTDLEAMLYRDRNHPSVILWSIGNEVPEQTQPGGHLIAKALQDICHRIDPSRLCTHANDQICAEPHPATEEFLNALDVVGYNYTGRWRTRAETLYDDDKRKHPHWRIIGTENPSAAGVRGDYRLEIPSGYWRHPYFAHPVNAGDLLRFTMTRDYVAGDFMWTGIDYLGEAFWPSRSASCGVLDTCGFPKDHYYLYQSVWKREHPMIHIFPHCNLDVPDGMVIPVLCYTNCDCAELFVNGKSYGKKAISYPRYGMTETYGHFDTPPRIACTNDLFLSWDVPFTPDTIEAVGYIGGKAVCSKSVKAAGKPERIIATTDTSALMADGLDIAHIEIMLVDGSGIHNPVATNRVNIDVEGPAELIGLDNGKPDCHESLKGNTMPAHGGMLLALLRSKRETGCATVTIKSEGLTACTLLIDVCP